MSRSSHDAVVIGAGPAGSAVAIVLARAGWSVALVEKEDFDVDQLIALDGEWRRLFRGDAGAREAA